jgi:hypothetical protein
MTCMSIFFKGEPGQHEDTNTILDFNRPVDLELFVRSAIRSQGKDESGQLCGISLFTTK